MPIDNDEDPNATPWPEGQTDAGGETQDQPKDENMQPDGDIQQDDAPANVQHEQNEGEKRAADETGTTTSKKAKVLQRNNTQ